MTCLYDTKRTYRTRADAREGAWEIRQIVEHRGVSYTTLYPFRCPDDDHWHLSHYRQGFQDCVWCDQRVPAFFTGTWWIIPRHGECVVANRRAA